MRSSLLLYSISHCEHTLSLPPPLSPATAPISPLHHKAAWASGLLSLLPFFTSCSLTCPYCAMETFLGEVTSNFRVAKSNGSLSSLNLIPQEHMTQLATSSFLKHSSFLVWIWCSSWFSFCLFSLFFSGSTVRFSSFTWPLRVAVPQGLVLKQLLVSVWSSQHDLTQSSSSKYHLNSPDFTSLSLNPDWSIQPAALCLHLAVWQTPQIISFQWSPWFFLSSNSPHLLFPLTPLELLCSSICSD